MAVTTTNTNKPINPRGDDKSPLAFNRAKIYSGKALDFDGGNDSIDTDGFSMTGANASFVWILKADASSGFIFDANPSRFAIGDNGQNTFSIYTNADGWHEFANYPDYVNTYFMSVVVEGTSAKAYINGKPFGINGTITAQDFSTWTQSSIMGRYTNDGGFWNGQLSGFKIFNTALTAAQVLDLYNNPEKIVPTGVSNDALKLWLPMMEGAGTTAYDGSGNGNHGTISGATWTHGVGAPVAQTAVIDWNKGTNLLLQSNQFDTSWQTLGSPSLSSGQSGYDGSTDAWLYTNNGSEYIYQDETTSVATYSVFAKKGNGGIGDFVLLFVDGVGGRYFDLATGVLGSEVLTGLTDSKIEPVSGTTDWYRCSITFASSTRVRIYASLADNNFTSAASIYIQDAQLESASTAGPYVLTLSTAQSSEVLIPQSLTSGRDLFYNLFENVRKKYALNLDGQSWAEIHDNESLDMGTGSFSLEAWVRTKYVSQGSVYNTIMTLGGDVAQANNTGLTNTSSRFYITYNTNGTLSSSITEGEWVHIVGSYDETNVTLYINNIQVDQDARTAVDITNDLVKMIGRDATTLRYYNDQIAQPRIYNRALTADEVEQNYNAGKNTYS